LNTCAPVTNSTNRWIGWMKTQNRMPSSSPAPVPSAPIEAPAMKKMRRIEPRVAPMVRRMAMSRLLFFTSMTSPLMMFSATTATTTIRMSRMAVRSTCRASKKLEFFSVQSSTMEPGPAALISAGFIALVRSGSVTFTSITSMAWSRPKKSCACSSGM
jgi:hypothetical protein